LISSLLDVASSQDVPFHQLQQLHSMHHCPPLCPVFFPTTAQVLIHGRCIMASVQRLSGLYIFIVAELIADWTSHTVTSIMRISKEE